MSNTTNSVSADIRARAEGSLEFFINLVAPYYYLGRVHKDWIDHFENPKAKSHQLLLLPRDHGKSNLIGFAVAHQLMKDPTKRILYISATSTLAEARLGFIKNLLTSKIFQRYWPQHVNREEGRRTKWTNSEITLDHPLRKELNITEASVITAGLTKGITGLHVDITVLDDVVSPENAYKREGRLLVASRYSQLASIEGNDAIEWVVGTRYHPEDLYKTLLDITSDVYDSDGNVVDQYHIYDVFQREVEDIGDGSGTFLWPRAKQKDGKFYGFDRKTLAQKRAKYLDKGQYRAQYYNDPSDPDNAPIKRSSFKYWEPGRLKMVNGAWHYNGNILNVYAGIDFAYSTKKRADYTALVCVGVDSDGNYYILGIDRFKTGDISVYFEHILAFYNKWMFTKLIAEVTAAQEAIVKSLRKDYLIPEGVNVNILEVRPDKSSGTKEERIAANLEPRYEAGLIFHARDGMSDQLEEELVSSNPPHDDIKDTASAVISKLVRPTKQNARFSQPQNQVAFHGRFGGRG